MHNGNREQEGIYRETTSCRLSMDMLLVPKAIVHFHSSSFALEYSRSKVEVADYST
jgi:hypothetical protein